MDYLLDTQAFLWADAEPAKLSAQARSVMADPANRLFLSVASVWEMQIKNQLGKLPLRLPLEQLIEEHVSRGSLDIWQVSLPHVYELSVLPALHSDPFDRLIVAAARLEMVTLISAKAEIAQTLLSSRDIVLSVQVLQQFYVQATRQSRANPLTHDEALARIRTWRRFPTVDITTGILDDALAIKACYQLSYWDSAIIAAAKEGNCTEVLSEDMNDGQDYGGVKMINPFKP